MADRDAIVKYNAKAQVYYTLQMQLGPCPFEGDIESSPIVLLLANPGFDERSSTIDDHNFSVSGWPLAGLNEFAPRGMRDWWRPRLRTLCEKYGEQYIASHVAALQINPWASARFDSSLRLPSQAMMLGLAEDAAHRGAILLVMRAARLWLSSKVLDAHALRYRAKSPRCSYVTEGNLGGDAWQRINHALVTVKSVGQERDENKNG